MPTIEARIRKIIADLLGAGLEDVVDGANLVNDLGADDLDLVELGLIIEEEFRGEMSDEDFDKIKTVKDIIDFVTGKITMGEWKG